MSNSNTSYPRVNQLAACFARSMTMREWYASVALNGLLSGRDINASNHPSNLSRLAFEYADAMLEHEVSVK